MLYQNPQPVFDELAERYDLEYFEYERENEAQFLNLMELGLKDIGFRRLESVMEGGLVFLDVGCATGLLISSMAKRGWQSVGVEICRPAAEFGIRERGVDIRIGTLEDARFEDESFSIVHCSHLIEHLVDPLGFAREVHRILRPEGFFLVATPNTQGMQAKLLGPRWRSAIADHMVLFSKNNLTLLLNSAGFKVEGSKTWGGIAKGLAPAILKSPIDRLAKVFGFGDIMILRASKR